MGVPEGGWQFTKWQLLLQVASELLKEVAHSPNGGFCYTLQLAWCIGVREENSCFRIWK